MTSALFYILGMAWLSVPAPFSGPGLPLITMSPLQRMVYLDWTKPLSFLGFKLACLHILKTLLMVVSWSLPMLLNPAIRMSSALPNIFGSPWNSSSIFLGNISPASATPNSSCMHLYLPKVQEKVVKYDDCLSSLKLWYPDLPLISIRYLTPANLSKMLLRVGPCELA